MENKKPKVIQSDANGPLSAAGKQPYVALKVEVMSLEVECGFAGSLLGNEAFNLTNWDEIDHASSNEAFNFTDWDKIDHGSSNETFDFTTWD